MTTPDYTSLPPQEALLKAKDELYDLLEQQRQGRTSNADRTRIPDQLFTVTAIVNYLLTLVKVQQKEIVVLKEQVKHLLAR